MQNLGWFYTTSDFDREYLRNETRYPKSESYVIENDTSHVQRHKSHDFGPLPRKQDMWVWTHPNRHFQETIFWPLDGAGRWNFYTH